MRAEGRRFARQPPVGKSAGWPMPLRSRRPDTHHVESVDPKAAGDPVLTPAQMRFAREHRARPRLARESDGSVFFYRDHYHGTERWLVDSEGQVLDEEYFRGSATARAANGESPATGEHRINTSLPSSR